jgi:hypothetical protein
MASSNPEDEMVVWAACAAMAGDLDGWAGQPWGSTVGGPEDPAMEDFFRALRASGGEQALTLAGGLLSTEQTWFGMPATGNATFLQGELAEARLAVPADQTRELLESLTATLGTSVAIGTAQVFGNGVVTVAVAPDMRWTRVNVVSDTHRARCVELRGKTCTLQATRAEVLAERAAQPELAALADKMAARQIELAESGQIPIGDMLREAEARQAEQQLEHEFAVLEADVRAHCVPSSLGVGLCAQAKARLASRWTAFPAARPADEAACIAKNLPAKCWRW